MARKSAEENRQHVLATASGLFYRHGVRAVGMDQIVREAGVGNATLYRQFPTKDDLATAFVQERADAWFERMCAEADAAASPREALLAVFEVTARDVAGSGYRGCPMLNTHTEFPEPGHPAHAVAVEHKQQVRDWLRDLAARAGTADPEALADDLVLVLNGALATAAVLGPAGPSRRALALATRLVDTALGD